MTVDDWAAVVTTWFSIGFVVACFRGHSFSRFWAWVLFWPLLVTAWGLLGAFQIIREGSL